MTIQTPAPTAAAVAFENAEFPTATRGESKPNPYTAPLATLVESRKGAAITVTGRADVKANDALKEAIILLRKAANGYGVSLKIKTVEGGNAKAPTTRVHFIVVDKITRERKPVTAAPSA